MSVTSPIGVWNAVKLSKKDLYLLHRLNNPGNLAAGAVGPRAPSGSVNGDISPMFFCLSRLRLSGSTMVSRGSICTPHISRPLRIPVPFNYSYFPVGEALIQY